MILIEHIDIDNIVKEYADELISLFEAKRKPILHICSLLKKDSSITKEDVNGVKKHLQALKLVLGKENLQKPKKQIYGRDTDTLIYNLNKYRIHYDKRSKCRKNKRVEEVLKQIQIIFGTVKLHDLFTSEPSKLKELNSHFAKKFIEPQLYLHFFDHEKYYSFLNSNISQKLDLRCCPYCNRNFISYVHTINNKKVIGPTYDHFFLKKEFKFLTLSFYNLIPSCYVCNSNLKHQIPFDLSTHQHPYVEQFGEDAKFDFDISNSKGKIVFTPQIKLKLGLKQSSALKISGDLKNSNDLTSGNIRVFKLQEIYATHSDTVEEVHTKFDKNSPFYVQSIKDSLKALKVSEEEFYRFHFNNYFNPGDFHRRPLAKLTKDIYEKMKDLQ